MLYATVYTQIYVKLWHDQEGYHMKISDNGHPLSSYYKEGGVLRYAPEIIGLWW